ERINEYSFFELDADDGADDLIVTWGV
ncbi:hypothetical protein MNBD_BACTEROID04-1348, partial [hydrothermal vent metagenome]